ncbi:hypothetical protein HDU91_003502 [Kappamyces sp. JEL0680]|nr:hypothetical protein HDU91_003502 [Kappamyces sp. JEL0680]
MAKGPPLPPRVPEEAPPTYTLEDIQSNRSDLPSSPSGPPQGSSYAPARPGSNASSSQTKQVSHPAPMGAIPTSSLVGELVTRGVAVGMQAASIAVKASSQVVQELSKSSTVYPDPAPPNSSAQRYNQPMTATPSAPPSEPYPPYQSQQSQQPHTHHMGPMVFQANTQYDTTASQSYWAPIGNSKAWQALFFYLTLNFVWSIFCFVWVLVTFVVSVVLLVLFPIGFPLLVASCLSWRSLVLLEQKFGNLFDPLTTNVPSPCWVRDEIAEQKGDYFGMMKAQIFSFSTWRCGGHLFWRFFPAIFLFVNAVVTVVIAIPFTCLLPPLLNLFYRQVKRDRLASLARL